MLPRSALSLGITIAVAGLALGPIVVPHAAADGQYGGGYVPSGARLTPSAGLRALEADGVYGATAGTDLPANVDLTAWAAPAGDQGSVNSCVSWAIGYTLLGWYARRMSTPTTFAPMYIYSQTHLSNSPDGGGSYVRDAFKVVSSQGVDTAADYQPQGDYDFTTMPTDAQRSGAAPYSSLGSTRLYQSASGNVGPGARTAIEQSLAAGRPVGLALPIYDSFYYLDAHDSDFTNAEATGANEGYHYVAVLGYDADGVTIENSWGTWWGDRGFAHLDWAFVTARTVEAESAYGFAASSLPVPPQTVTPSPAPTPTASPAPSTSPSVTPPPATEAPVAPTPTIIPVPQPSVSSVPAAPTVSGPTTSTEPPFMAPTPTTPAATSIDVPTPATAPSVPVRLTPATGASDRVAAQWSAPTSDGGAPVTDYRVLVRGAGISKVLLVQQPTFSLHGLRPYTAYTVTVQAVNGRGMLSPATSVVVRTAAIAPRVTSFAARDEVLRWRVSSTGSGRVTAYHLVVRRSGAVVLDRTYPSATTRIRTTLPSGHRYTAVLTVSTASGRTATDRTTLR